MEHVWRGWGCRRRLRIPAPAGAPHRHHSHPEGAGFPRRRLLPDPQHPGLAQRGRSAQRGSAGIVGTRSRTGIGRALLLLGDDQSRARSGRRPPSHLATVPHPVIHARVVQSGARGQCRRIGTGLPASHRCRRPGSGRRIRSGHLGSRIGRGAQPHLVVGTHHLHSDSWGEPGVRNGGGRRDHPDGHRGGHHLRSDRRAGTVGTSAPLHRSSPAPERGPRR